MKVGSTQVFATILRRSLRCSLLLDGHFMGKVNYIRHIRQHDCMHIYRVIIIMPCKYTVHIDHCRGIVCCKNYINHINGRKDEENSRRKGGQGGGSNILMEMTCITLILSHRLIYMWSISFPLH